jgi:hypothetical protein
MSDAFNGSNPGFVLWQLSQQVSHARRHAARMRRVLESECPQGPDVASLLQDAEASAGRASAGWDRVRDSVCLEDPPLFVLDESWGVAIVRSRGQDAALAEAIIAAWRGK